MPRAKTNMKSYIQFLLAIGVVVTSVGCQRDPGGSNAAPPPRPLHVYVGGGGITFPGAIPFSEGMTLGDAISSAGGFTDVVDKTQVTLTRKGQKPVIIDYTEDNANPKDVELKAEDKIHVPGSFPQGSPRRP